MKDDNLQGIIFRQKAPARAIGPVVRLRRNLQSIVHLGKHKSGNPDGILNHSQTADIYSRLRSK